MNLTAFQKRCLESYLYLRGTSPTILRVLSFKPRGWLPFLGIAVASVLSFAVSPLLGTFMAGLTLGAVLRILAYARFTVMGWPVIEQVLDWDRIEDLLHADGHSAAGKAASPPA
jgi:hypothetical protein